MIFVVFICYIHRITLCFNQGAGLRLWLVHRNDDMWTCDTFSCVFSCSNSLRRAFTVKYRRSSSWRRRGDVVRGRRTRRTARRGWLLLIIFNIYPAFQLSHTLIHTLPSFEYQKIKKSLNADVFRSTKRLTVPIKPRGSGRYTLRIHIRFFLSLKRNRFTIYRFIFLLISSFLSFFILFLLLFIPKRNANRYGSKIVNVKALGGLNATPV